MHASPWRLVFLDSLTLADSLAHEVASGWLSQHVARKLQALLGKPAMQQRADQRHWIIMTITPPNVMS